MCEDFMDECAFFVPFCAAGKMGVQGFVSCSMGNENWSMPDWDSVSKGLTPLQISGSVICDKCKNHNWVGHFCRRASRGGKLVASTNNEGWFDDISVILMYMQVCVWRIMIHGVLCDAWWHKVRLASPHKM